MKWSFDIQESTDPWRGRQPKYERVVRIAHNRFGLATKLPNGEPIIAELGRRLANRSTKPS